MQAVLCVQYGGPARLVVASLPPPRPAADQVLIAVHACGVNYPDLLMIEGRYQIRPALPFVPGFEVAGRVLEAGEHVRQMRPGDRVLAFTASGGAFAEQVVADERTVMKLPDGMDDVVGAAFGVAYGTSYHALSQRGRLVAGETLLVLGAGGGVGLAAVELGKLMGARVVAVAGRPEKLEAARQRGADHLVDSSREPLRARLRTLTEGRGVDVAYDPVGGHLTQETVRSLAWGGRLLVVGFASGSIPAIPANHLLLRGAEAVGVYWGAFAHKEPESNRVNFADLFRRYEEGRLQPLVFRTLPLREAASALETLQQRAVVGKIVLRTEAP